MSYVCEDTGIQLHLFDSGFQQLFESSASQHLLVRERQGGAGGRHQLREGERVICHSHTRTSLHPTLPPAVSPREREMKCC